MSTTGKTCCACGGFYHDPPGVTLPNDTATNFTCWQCRHDSPYPHRRLRFLAALIENAAYHIEKGTQG